jgi:hypothetical protein
MIHSLCGTGRSVLVRSRLSSLSSARRFCLAAIIGSVLISLAANSASAVPINYGDFMGNSVTYKMVTEDSATDPTPLFGAPTVTGDTLDFNPVGFAASSMGGGADITDGQLSFMVQAKPGQSINNILIKEFGDTTLAGVVPVNSTITSTVVRMPVFIDIVEVNGVGINPIKLSGSSLPPIVATFNPSNGDFYLGVDGGGGPLYHTTWTGQLFVDLNAIQKGITKINVNLDNVLIAVSQQGTSALIAKKDFFTVTTNIPEPTSFGLALLAVAFAGCLGRRGR